MRRWIIPALFVLAAVLRLWQYGQPQLWYDESFTRLVARLDLPGLVTATAGDVHPPLWYVIEWITIRLLGESPWAMRLPSVLASMWGLWLMHQLGERLNISQAGLVAALAFLALSSTQIWYAQEARMYALLQALVLVAVLAVLDRKRVIFGLALTVMLWLHNYGLIYGAVIGAWACWRETRKPEIKSDLPQVLMAGCLAVISYVPWVIVLTSQMSQVSAGYWIQPIRAGTVIHALSQAALSFAVEGPMASVAPLILVGALTLAGIRSIQRREYGLLAWLALAPLAVVVLVSVVWRPVLLYRGLIASVPALALWLGDVLAGDRQRVINRVVAAVIVVPVLLAGQVTLWSDHDSKGKDADIVAEYIQPNYDQSTAIVHINDGSIVIFKAHSELPQLELDTGCPDPVGSLSPLTREALGIHRITLAEARAQYSRVILVGGVGATSTACEEETFKRLASNADQEIYRDESTGLSFVGVWLYDIW